VLNVSPSVTGIRFFYGLSDVLNPNSVKVFLVPCTHSSDFGNAKNLIIEEGYMDQYNQVHSILEVSQMIANWIISLNQRNPELKYKETTRGGFFWRNSLLDLVKDKECDAISYKFGLKDNVVSPVMQALDYENKIISIDPFMDVTRPCPTMCGPETSDPNCALELADLSTSFNTELDNYRWFRDHKLLEVEGGARQYELYYFLSPFVAMVINNNKSKEAILHRMYNEQIAPCSEFIKNGEYQKAFNLVESTLLSWIAEYQGEFNQEYSV
jgi:hypothetical protein